MPNVTLPPDLLFQKVLDSGYVKFIDSMGADETIIEAARMSTGRGFERWDAGLVCKKCRTPRELYSAICTDDTVNHEWTKTPGDAKLLEYLYSNGHMTPFEMVQIHVEVYAPILTFRQWHRHRVFSYNEMSGRYGPLPDEFYVPSAERIRGSLKASGNKQASGSGTDVTDATVEREIRSIEEEQRHARMLYEGRLTLGMAPELARINVPVSQYSRCRVSGDLRCWLDSFLRQRMDLHAQTEIREPANAAARIVQAVVPRTYALFEEYTLGASRFSRSEMVILRQMLARLPALVDPVNVVGHPYYGDENKARRGAFLKKLGIEG